MRSRAIIASSFFASVALAVCLCPVSAAARAQDSQLVSDSDLTVDQARAAFRNAGYQVDQPLSWAWTTSPVITFQIHDPAKARVVMVFVYPSAAAAQTERLQALAHERLVNAGAIGAEPHLVPGYGVSVWRDNLAMVQTSQSELDRVFQLQNDRDNCVYVDTDVVAPEAPSSTVDLEFQQALDRSVLVNL